MKMMANKRIVERIKLVLGDEQLPIGEIINRLSQLKTTTGKPYVYIDLEASRLCRIMMGKFEIVRIGSLASKNNEWRNKNVVDRKIQTEEIE
jgi:hypothetical protein